MITPLSLTVMLILPVVVSAGVGLCAKQSGTVVPSVVTTIGLPDGIESMTTKTDAVILFGVKERKNGILEVKLLVIDGVTVSLGTDASPHLPSANADTVKV